MLKKKEVSERQFSIVLPKMDNEGHEISSKKIEQYARAVSNQFGGVTINTKTLGCYISDEDKKLHCEENIQLVGAKDLDDPDIKDPQTQLQKDRDFINFLAKMVSCKVRGI